MENSVKSFLPDKQEIIRLFSIILVVSNFLAFLGFAYQFNVLIYKYSVTETLIILAYVLTYALLETIFVFFLLNLLKIILPREWMDNQFSIKGSLLYLFGTMFLYPWLGFSSSQGMTMFYSPVNDSPNKALFIILWVVLFTIIVYLIQRILKMKSNRDRLLKMIDNLIILSWIYLIFDCLSVIIISLRVIL